MRSNTLTITKMSREQRAKREDIAKDARCQGEQDAIVYYGYELGYAECGNCGMAFPPENPKMEYKRVWCSKWTEQKHFVQFCRAWVHGNNFAAGIAPPWCAPYTKERLNLEVLEGEGMKQAKVELIIYVVCPYCGKANGLRSLADTESKFVDGPPMAKACTFCKREFEVLTVRGEAK